MSVSPAMSVPPISPGEMQLLLSRAGLVLNPGQVADLVLAWRQVAGLIAAIPHDRPLADDMAYAFPPAAARRVLPRIAAQAAPAAASEGQGAVQGKARPGEGQGRAEAAAAAKPAAPASLPAAGDDGSAHRRSSPSPKPAG